VARIVRSAVFDAIAMARDALFASPALDTGAQWLLRSWCEARLAETTRRKRQAGCRIGARWLGAGGVGRGGQVRIAAPPPAGQARRGAPARCWCCRRRSGTFARVNSRVARERVGAENA